MEELQNFSDGFADSAIQKQIADYEAKKTKQVPFDRLRMYFGEDYWVNDNICISQPTVQDYLDIEEKNMNAIIAPFTSNPTTYRVQLWDLGIDWNNVKDIELFAMLVKSITPEMSRLMFNRTMTPKERENFIIDHHISDEEAESINWKAKEMLQPIDFRSFELYSKQIPQVEKTVEETENPEINQTPESVLTLYSPTLDMEIDEDTYKKMAEYVRYMFNSHPTVEHCKGKTLKRQLIQNERLKQAKQAQEMSGSQMVNMVSFALNHAGFKYKKDELRQCGIVEFMDSIQRLQVYEQTRALFSGSYSGMMDTSKIDKNQFNFMRDLTVEA